MSDKNKIFLGAVFLVGAINFYFHWKASKKIDELKQLIKDK